MTMGSDRYRGGVTGGMHQESGESRPLPNGQTVEDHSGQRAGGDSGSGQPVSEDDVPGDSPTQRTTLGTVLASGGAPIDRPSAWMWLLFTGLGFLGGQVLAAATVGIAAVLAGQFHDLTALSKLAQPPTWFVVATLAGLWGGFLGAAILASRLRGTKALVPDMGLQFRLADLIGIPIGLVGQLLVVAVYVPIAPHVHNFDQRFSEPAHRLTGGSHGVGFVAIALCTVVGAPFFEELFFRGVLMRALARLFGTWGRWVGPALAVVVSGVAFGLAHYEPLQLLGLSLFGVILGAVSYRTGRLGMNMVAHATFNGLALAATAVVPALAHGWPA